MSVILRVRCERWPIAGAFTISRGSKTEAEVVVAELTDGPFTGRGECTHCPRYGETVPGVAAAIASFADDIGRGLDRVALQSVLPAGAARNALDCAFIDLEAKRTNRPAHELLGIAPARPCLTAYTISFGPPEEMAQAAAAAATRPLLKIKLGRVDGAQSITVNRYAAPVAGLLVDSNERLHRADSSANPARWPASRVTVLEQPPP